MADPLADLRYLSIGHLKPRLIGDSQEEPGVLLDPAILLPIVLPGEVADPDGHPSPEAITWEAIVTGMLKLLAYKPEVEHAEYYRRFILAVKPSIHDEFTQAGILKTRNGELELAVDIFRALAGVFPECPGTRNNFALVCEQLGRAAAEQGDTAGSEHYASLAFEAYKRAVEIDPELADPHFNFAYFYLGQSNFPKAREHFDRFLALDPASERAASVRAVLREIEGIESLEGVCTRSFDAITLGRESEAIGVLEEYTRRYPDKWNPWFLLGWAYRRLGRYGEGRRALEKAHSLKPDKVDTLNELAICLTETGNDLESHRRLSEALRLEPENPKLSCNLGLLTFKMGRAEEARRHFEAVLALSPEDPLAREYLRRLSS